MGCEGKREVKDDFKALRLRKFKRWIPTKWERKDVRWNSVGVGYSKFEKCILNNQMMSKEYQTGNYFWPIRSFSGSYSTPTLRGTLNGIGKHKNKTKKQF